MTDYSSEVERIRNARSLEEIQAIARQYPAKAIGEGGILYSRPVGDVPSEVIAKELANRTGAPIINDTPRAQFLSNEAVSRAVDQSARRIFEGQGQAPVLAKQSAMNFLYGDAKAVAHSATSLDGCLWGEASRDFAGSLRGDVKVVATAANMERVFGRVEIPAVLNNPNVNTLGGQSIARLREIAARDGVQALLDPVQAQFVEAAPKGVFVSPESTGPTVTKVALSREFATSLGANAGELSSAAELTASGLTRAPIGLNTPVAAIEASIGEATIASRATSARGLSPGVARATGVVGVVGMAVDVGVTVHKASQLYGQGNTEGAKSELVHFGTRTVGTFGGAALGATAGAAAGVETGPGLLVTGAVGGIIGAVAGDKVADWIDHHKIYAQDDRVGHAWHFDPKHPDRGWTRTLRELDDVAMTSTTIDMPIYKTRTITADQSLSNELNYKASSMSAQLVLANPPTPRDPYTIPANKEDAHSVVRSDWNRDAQNGTWRREVVDNIVERGIKLTHSETASPTRAVELERASQKVITQNAATSPESIAARYQAAHDQYGWAKYGPPPEAVTRERRDDGRNLQASDGSTYQRGRDGEWTHDGWLGDSKAEGNVRTELNATYKRLHNDPAIEVQQPKATVPSSAPVNQHRPRQSSTDMRDPDHSGHREYQHALDTVRRYEGSQGITSGAHSETLAAHLAAIGEREKFNLHHLEKGADGQLVAVQRGPYISDPERRIGINPQAALSQSVEHYSTQFSAARSPHYASNAPAADRTQEQSQALAKLSPTDQQMFARIRDGVPAHISDDVVASALYAAKKEGIDRADKIGDAMMVGDRLWVAGTTPGFRASVDVAAVAPNAQETTQQIEALNQKQLLAQQQHEAQAQQQGRSGPAMSV